jgi:sulfate/thiosulfate transport system ATP-binding protein
MSIVLRDVSKTFGTFKALDGVSLTVGDGQLLALLGPSGSGKTTLLRVIAGLEVPDSGTILFDDGDATERRPRDRGVGFVFQHYALFRHMTVAGNVAFGLEARPRATRPSKRVIECKVEELLHLVGLAGHADRYPSQLSGGQRQRVALARALAVEPRVLLLDEPFGALDANVRRELRRWLRRLHDELRVTSVFVTHDQEEALELADSVVIFNEGKIEQVGTPDEICEAPRTPFVYRFIGRVNLLEGIIDGGCVIVEGQRFELPPGAAPHAWIGFRPHEVELSAIPAREHLVVRVRTVNRLGAVVALEAETESGQPLRIEVARDHPAASALRGDRLWVRPMTLSAMARGGERVPDASREALTLSPGAPALSR